MGAFLLIPILLPVLGGLAVMFLKAFKVDRNRNRFTAVILCLTTVSVLVCCFIDFGSIYLWKVTETISFKLSTDDLTKVFSVLMSVMMTLVGFYSFEYMRHENNKEGFFGFYLCVMGVLNGIYMSSNLLTMYLFYELMTLLSLPLVLHNRTKEAINAGKKYLYYSIAGAFLSLLSIFYIYSFTEQTDFAGGGIINPVLLSGHENTLLVFVFLAIIGFGCKAGLFPLHDWLPTAHPVAPAPASAILSGIITKSGVIAIIRLVFYSIGADLIKGTWVQYTWSALTLFTVFMGSMLAFNEKVLKRRLALSTVSQVSYVLFGLSLLNPVGFVGAILHVVFHSIIKDDLFLVSGVIIHNTGATRVDQLKAIGKKMPIAIGCFTVVSLGLVGIPPFSGFISKWYLATGALESGLSIIYFLGPVILLISALLTAGYLFPVTIDGFFPGKDFDATGLEKCEAGRLSVIPMVILAVAALLFGIFPGPLAEFARNIAMTLGL